MDIKDIQALMEQFDRSALTDLHLQTDGVTLSMGKQAGMQRSVPEAAPAIPSAATQSVRGEEASAYIKAPLVGTFYAAAAPGEAAFVREGDHVKKDAPVCVLEAMKMMSQVPAPFDCVIEKILIADGTLVSFDQPIFQVKAV
ncbi:MAG: acetyl-CoA carboxylase biotin carboxyl carrier protein subunit [Oscillospiraceae bacterium]|nr:acetyl-CoA carboxylase biotin carboxyl carrier protein subunit [Oscillospiraceae bacterium]